MVFMSLPMVVVSLPVVVDISQNLVEYQFNVITNSWRYIPRVLYVITNSCWHLPGTFWWIIIEVSYSVKVKCIAYFAVYDFPEIFSWFRADNEHF